MNYIKEYYNKIEKGKIITSKRVARQYKKLVQDIEHSDKYIFDLDKANKPIDFIETFCRHSKGEWAGKQLKLELFQKAYIQALFGFLDKKTELRRYRESLFMVGRKNGKTTFLGGIALYMLVADDEGGSEVYSVASKRDQANIIFDEVHNMVNQNITLSKHIRKRKADLYFDTTMSKFQSLGKNSNSLDGLNSHLVVIDELHAIKDRALYEVMQQSMSARQQPLLVMITTAGTIRENIFDEMYDYACNIVDDNFKDDAFLPMIYELDKEEEWKDSKCWAKANPGLDTIKKLDDLERKVERAKNDPVSLPGVLCKDFNIKQTNYQSWLSFGDIENTDTFNIADFKGSYAIGGADLSSTLDLTVASLLLLDEETDKKYIHQMYFLPKDNFIERVEEDKIPYDKWRDQGLLRLCNGNTIDYGDITAWFLEMMNDYEITPLWIYYDSWSATYWKNEMSDLGFNMIPAIQGAKTLSLPMKTMGADLKAKKINYNNSPILKWCLSNTSIETDRNDNIVPVKTSNPKMKIDGTVSMLNCYVGLLDRYEEFRNSM